MISKRILRLISLTFLSGIFFSLPLTAEAKTQKNTDSTKNTFEKPDFAYPATVEKNANSVLAKGDASWVEKLRAAMQITLASDMVTASAAPRNAAMLDSLANLAPMPYSNLFYLMEATLYKDIYNRAAWKYASRNLPLTTFPDDPTAWSKGLFSLKICELTKKAMRESLLLRAKPLKDFAPILDSNFKDYEYFPTLYDFVAVRTLDNLSSFGSIPFGVKSGATPTETVSEICREQITFYRAAGKVAPLTYWILRNRKSTPEEWNEYLLTWYGKLEDSPYAGNLLPSVNRGSMTATQKRSFYNLLKDAVSKFPAADMTTSLQNIIYELSAESVQVSLPERTISSEPFSVKATLNNVPSAYLLVMEIPRNISDRQLEEAMFKKDSAEIRRMFSGFRCMEAKPVSCGDTVPFSNTLDVRLKGLGYGRYLVLPSKSADISGLFDSVIKNRSISMLTVSDMTIITSYVPDKEKSLNVYVASARNQKPLQGVKVDMYQRKGRTDTKIQSLVTDASGKVSCGFGDYKLKVVNGNDRLDYNLWSYYNGKRTVDSLRVALFTDLSVYHPGDTVRFAGIAFDPKRETVARDSKIRMEFLDANATVVDSLSLVSDATGRFSGNFPIPRTGLLGNWELLAGYPGGSDCQSVTVAEYKAPTFFVDVDTMSSEYKIGDVVKISGRVLTYSGMPVSDARIAFDVNAVPWFRFYDDSSQSDTFGGDARADSAGRFSIELPTATLRNTPYARALFSLNITATSAAGESQQSRPVTFSLGEAFTIGADFPEAVKIGKDAAKLPVKVMNILRQPVKKSVLYEIYTAEDKFVKRGEFVSPDFNLNTAEFPQGKYKVKFMLAGNPEVTYSTEIVLYKEGDASVPYATPLWLPETRYVYDDSLSKVAVTVGSAYNDSWLLLENLSADGSVTSQWLRVDAVNSRVEIPVSPASRYRLSVVGTHDLDMRAATVELIAESLTEDLKTEVKTFRDKITPRNCETWEFSFSKGNSPVGDVSAMAVMTDKALNAIVPFAWSFSPRLYFASFPQLTMRLARPGDMSDIYTLAQRPYKSVKEGPVSPRFNFYGCFSMLPGYRIRGTRNSVAQLDGALYAVAEAPVMMSRKEAVTEEKAEAAVENESADMAASTGAAADQEQKEPLRAVSCPLAFFKPDLQAEKDGNLKVSFDVPDFNTTWQFQLLGFTPDLQSSITTLEAVASKPVMVQSVMPGFVRTGDTVRFGVTLYNNGDEPREISGKVEIFDPLTGKILYTLDEAAATVPAMNSRVIYPEFTAPDNLQTIGIRAYAVSPGFSDGEQNIIAVLPSSSPVIDSEPFYLNQNAGEKTFRLPDFKNDATVTLRYCDNPVWTVVTSLPDIMSNTNASVFSKMYALYGNLVAAGITQKYPRVRSAISDWISNPADSVLVSPLNKNGDLKTFALDNTIWVRNAASETLRMSRLNTLLDKQTVDAATKQLADEVKALQNNDGGWSWCPGMTSSEYITCGLLTRLGMLRKMGYLPGTFDKSVEKGIRYCDEEILKDYKKNKTIGSSIIDWLYMRSFFTPVTTGEVYALQRKALKYLADNWRKLDIYDAATAAILLRSQNPKVAGNILTSLSEKALKTPERGMCYDNISSGFSAYPSLAITTHVLSAFHDISPKAPEIDMLRQWLLLQRQTQDWGGDRYIVDAVYALLSTGTDWTEPADKAPQILLNGKFLEIPAGSHLIGEFTMNLNPRDVSGGEITVRPSGQHPAWGAVMSQYIQPMADVKAADVPDLSITKEIYAVSETEKGSRLDASALKPGMKVRVTLTITCRRAMNYVAVSDERAACLRPVEQTAAYTVKDGIWMYYEPRTSDTNLFISYLGKGTHVVTYDCYVEQSGDYSLGIATVQSQYAPSQVAHSGGHNLPVAQ